MVAIEFIQAQLSQGRDKRLQAAARLIVGCEIFVVAPIGPVLGEHSQLLRWGDLAQQTSSSPVMVATKA
jgi:hypothetical protein